MEARLGADSAPPSSAPSPSSKRPWKRSNMPRCRRPSALVMSAVTQIDLPGLKAHMDAGQSFCLLERARAVGGGARHIPGVSHSRWTKFRRAGQELGRRLGDPLVMCKRGKPQPAGRRLPRATALPGISISGVAGCRISRRYRCHLADCDPGKAVAARRLRPLAAVPRLHMTMISRRVKFLPSAPEFRPAEWQTLPECGRAPPPTLAHVEQAEALSGIHWALTRRVDLGYSVPMTKS